MSPMAKLILVKHAPPEITPDVISHRWVLSAEGRHRCDWLAAELGAQGVTRLYSSLEPKALETAALVAIRLGLDLRPRRDLQENDRIGVAFGSPDALKQRMQRFFAEPSEQVVGQESAYAALNRFEAAIRVLTAESLDRTVAVVTHGTVLSLLVAKHNPIAPFDFWNGLALPSYVVLDAADFRLDGAARNFPA